jgi:hypothetical protein
MPSESLCAQHRLVVQIQAHHQCHLRRAMREGQPLPIPRVELLRIIRGGKFARRVISPVKCKNRRTQMSGVSTVQGWAAAKSSKETGSGTALVHPSCSCK